MRDDVRERLIEVAKLGKTITYGELMTEFRIGRRLIGKVVGEIGDAEAEDGRPRLSTIAVRRDTGYPNPIFLNSRNIPPHVRRSLDNCDLRMTAGEREYIETEQRNVWAYWK
jgi:hypothetical protein